MAPWIDRVNGIYLRLHGALVAQGHDDPESEMIAAVREMFGPDLPIAVSLDLHTHFTTAMAAGTDLIAGFRTCPHTDYYDTGARALRLLLARLDGARPVMRFRKVPTMAAAESHNTTSGPLVDAFERIDEIAPEPAILDATMFLTQPWLDIPQLGWTALVVADGDAELAQLRADELAGMLWDRRYSTTVGHQPVGTSISGLRVMPRHSRGEDQGVAVARRVLRATANSVTPILQCEPRRSLSYPGRRIPAVCSPLHRTELAWRDEVEVGPGAVGEIFRDTVEGQAVDLRPVMQLERDLRVEVDPRQIASHPSQ